MINKINRWYIYGFKKKIISTAENKINHLIAYSSDLRFQIDNEVIELKDKVD